MSWRTRWNAYEGNETEIAELVSEIGYDLLTASECNNVFVPSGLILGCVEVIDGDIYINECECDMVNIYINEGCGCGSGNTDTGSNSSGVGASTPPQSIIGSSSGGNYGGFVTICDAIASLPSYITASLKGWIGTVQNYTFIAEVLPIRLIPLYESIKDSLSEVEGEIETSGFQTILTQKIAKFFNNPWTDLARQDLRNFAYTMPQLYSGAPMWAAFVLWAEVVNLNAMNDYMYDNAGSGNETECKAVLASVNREYIPLNGSGSGGSSVISYDAGIYTLDLHLIKVAMPLQGSAQVGLIPLYLPDKKIVGCGMKEVGTPYYQDGQYTSIRMWVQADSLDRELIHGDIWAPENSTSWSVGGYSAGEITASDADAMLEMIETYFGEPLDIWGTGGFQVRDTTGDTGQISIGAYSGAPVDFTNDSEWAFVITKTDNV